MSTTTPTLEIQAAKPSTPISKYIIWIVIILVVLWIIRGFAVFANSPIGKLLGSVLGGLQSAIAWMLNNPASFLWILAGIAFLFSPLAGLTWRAMSATARSVSKLVQGEGKEGNNKINELGEEKVRSYTDYIMNNLLSSEEAKRVGIDDAKRLVYKEKANAAEAEIERKWPNEGLEEAKDFANEEEFAERFSGNRGFALLFSAQLQANATLARNERLFSGTPSNSTTTFPPIVPSPTI
jgi:hypothetical protein